MAKMLREIPSDLEIRDREVHTAKLPRDLAAIAQDIDWADVIITQPIADTYRNEPWLSLRGLREHKRPDARIAVFPSLFFRAYTPQVHYLPPLEAVAMPYHDAYLLRGYAQGRGPEPVAAELDDPDFIPAALIQREYEAGLRELRQREAASCDVAASDMLEQDHRAKTLFHTPNHPARDVLWGVLDRALDHLGVRHRPDRDGTDYLADLTIPPPAAVAATWQLPGSAFYRLPKRANAISRREYAAELWTHYATLGGPSALGVRLADSSGLTGFLRRHDEAGRPVRRPKRNFGSCKQLVTLPSRATQTQWREACDASWTIIPPRPRIAPAPIVDCRADLVFFLTKTHHAHQVGLWSYPSGTLSRARGLSVASVEKAEGAVLGAKGFYHATQWLAQAVGLPTDLIERQGRDIHVNVDALTGPASRLGEYIHCFDGNWRNYYHWMIDCVSRLFVLKTVSDGKILMPARRENLSAFHLDSLRHLGIAEDRLVWPDPARTLEKFQHLVWMNWNPTPWGGIGMLADLRAAYRASAGRGDAPGHRKLYVSRRGGRRRVKRADEVETLMRRLGFETIVPETLSFAEQARIFGEAAWVVGPHGAGLTNILFAPKDCIVVEFMPDALCRPHYWGMATSLAQVYGVLVVPGKSYFDDLDVDPARLEAFLLSLAAAVPPSAVTLP